jgi:hypothetical protein
MKYSILKKRILYWGLILQRIFGLARRGWGDSWGFGDPWGKPSLKRRLPPRPPYGQAPAFPRNFKSTAGVLLE